mmetsp:Transcript_22320/g.31971  ORF Transcript_22320/g.31971 Transcript_22320/m.31971 type:complete len:139 (-) Transcript_22320:925-1341(-)
MGPLITMVVCIILSYTMNFSKRGIKTVKTIPPGLPDFTAPWWHPLDTRIFPTVFLAIIVGFMESISIAIASLRLKTSTPWIPIVNYWDWVRLISSDLCFRHIPPLGHFRAVQSNNQWVPSQSSVVCLWQYLLGLHCSG